MHDDPSEHDDLHDRGLVFDLATLRARASEPTRYERRGALKLLAGAGAGLVLVACGSAGSTASTTTTTGAPSTTAGGGTTTTGSSGTAVDPIPEETGGPYPGDGSTGPNVLVEGGIVREDIRSSFGAYSGTAEGVPLTIDLTVVTAATGVPATGAAVYLWHCDREGRYSLYSSGVTDQNYLRGVQEAGDDGRLRFTSIFPAAYSGRWPHLHFEVFSDLVTATSGGSPIVTSQLALPDDVCTTVYATDGYEQSVTNLARTSLDGDMVFSDGYDDQLAAVRGTVDGGLTATLTVGV
jgi:protocatechuate 3,4-dioxygenase beta subunit